MKKGAKMDSCTADIIMAMDEAEYAAYRTDTVRRKASMHNKRLSYAWRQAEIPQDADTETSPFLS